MSQSKLIILIGPMGAGKTTIGALLAEKLNIPQVSMDNLRWDYYNEINYNSEKGKQLLEQDGFEALYRYWKPFEAYAVERILADHDNCVIDLGGGHSVYEDEALFTRVETAFEPYDNVILLLPSSDLDRSVKILRERVDYEIDTTFDVFELFTKHPSNQKLAKHVVYTEGKTPQETCTEILNYIKSQA